MFEISYFNTRNNEVVFYPYRTALVENIFATFEAKTDKEMRDYMRAQRELSEAATKVFENGQIVLADRKVEPDNHTCYKVGDLVFRFSDWRIHIGTGVRTGIW